MRVTELDYLDHPVDHKVDVHFKNEDSAKRFSNYHLSLTGKRCTYGLTSENVTSTVRANINDISDYPYTTNEYIDRGIVESFLQIFPEEVE